MNQIMAHGRLTDDVKQSTPFTDRKGKDRAAFKFTLASNRSFSRDKTDFFDCVWFLPVGNRIVSYLKKGTELVVSGEVEISSYEDNDGNKRRSTQILVNNIEFAGSKNSSATSSASNPPASSPKSEPETGGVEEDDDLPF